ncbi:3-isopropylmalate dehydratase small subunit [Sphingomonas sp. 179-I 2A4 NHS]|uniref:3-isopropylmalate dehydratase small subunit n=1 Tax=unclassified Sphingomonas TaxID=196159 RepID=UPI0038793820
MSAAPFDRLTSIAAPLVRDNVDTDAIIPSREMKSVSKKGLADGLFAGWRYTAVGGRDPDPAFVLNQPAFAGAQILLGGANFGCGSSREHAAWALAEYGFRVIVATSFNPIFRGNCIRNGIVPVELDAATIAELAQLSEAGAAITVDLEAQVVSGGDRRWTFAIENEARQMLLAGLDAIDLTLQRAEQIRAFTERDRATRGWAYLG